MTCSYTNVTITGYNASPPPDDGSEVSGNVIEWAKHKEKLGDPLKTAIESMDSNIDSLCSSINSNFSLKFDDTSFHVYLGSDQNVVSGNTFEHIVHDTEAFDVGSNFASGTYTVPSTGKYLFCVGGTVNDLTDGMQMNQAIYVNDSLKKKVSNLDSPKASNTMTGVGTVILSLSKDDTVEHWGAVGGASRAWQGDDETLTWFMGVRLE